MLVRNLANGTKITVFRYSGTLTVAAGTGGSGAWPVCGGLCALIELFLRKWHSPLLTSTLSLHAHTSEAMKNLRRRIDVEREVVDRRIRRQSALVRADFSL